MARTLSAAFGALNNEVTLLWCSALYPKITARFLDPFSKSRAVVIYPPKRVCQTAATSQILRRVRALYLYTKWVNDDLVLATILTVRENVSS